MDRIEFKNFAGLRINGKVKMPKPNNLDLSHFARASYLTAQVESGGKFGTVISYDGTGMTAGIHQAIAVYPATLSDQDIENDQGPLWRLLYSLKNIWITFAELPVPEIPSLSWPQFEKELAAEGYSLSSSGLLHSSTQKRVSGGAIRSTFTGSSDGLMPKVGDGRKMAEHWIELFHKLFSSPWTFSTQLDFGDRFFSMESIKHLRFCKNADRKQQTVREYFYSKEPLAAVSPASLGSSLDLAMCVYWSNSVNAPGYALKLLCKVADSYSSVRDSLFAKALITTLGNTSFGRWDDDIVGGRYQRTRVAAMQVWPKELFEGSTAIMPKDLVG